MDVDSGGILETEIIAGLFDARDTIATHAGLFGDLVDEVDAHGLDAAKIAQLVGHLELIKKACMGSANDLKKQ